MTTGAPPSDRLADEVADLRARLAEAEETLDAIRSGAVDALVVKGPEGERVYTLANADRVFRELAERMTDGAATVAGDGTILWANEHLASLLGRPLGRLVGSPIGSLAPAVSDWLGELVLDPDLRRRSAEGELPGPDGSLVPVRVSVSHVTIEDVVARAVVVTNLTEDRRTEALLHDEAARLEHLVDARTAELEASKSELENALDARREADQLRDAFIDVTAHELKTPLTTIYGNLQLLARADPKLTPETRLELIRDAAAEAERLVNLTNDLLVLTRVERGAAFIAREPLVLDRVVADAVARALRRNPSQPITVTQHGRLPVVSGDVVYVDQVLTNLLVNAFKYAAPPFEVILEPREDGVAVRVLDHGPGFTALPDQLFGLFYREARVKGRASGGGIGLFVCRELVKRMGGHVWAASRKGEGAEFGFYLPPYGAGETEAAEPTAPPEPAASEPAAPPEPAASPEPAAQRVS